MGLSYAPCISCNEINKHVFNSSCYQTTCYHTHVIIRLVDYLLSDFRVVSIPISYCSIKNFEKFREILVRGIDRCTQASNDAPMISGIDRCFSKHRTMPLCGMHRTMHHCIERCTLAESSTFGSIIRTVMNSV